jgi:hypothetical protein
VGPRELLSRRVAVERTDPRQRLDTYLKPLSSRWSSNAVKLPAEDLYALQSVETSEKLIALTQYRATRAHPGMRQYGAHTSWHLREHQISHIRSVSSNLRLKR